jgi:hypothetical protein
MMFLTYFARRFCARFPVSGISSQERQIAFSRMASRIKRQGTLRRRLA